MLSGAERKREHNEAHTRTYRKRSQCMTIFKRVCEYQYRCPAICLRHSLGVLPQEQQVSSYYNMQAQVNLYWLSRTMIKVISGKDIENFIGCEA